METFEPGSYIRREVSEAIEEAGRFFSVITVTGPRQSGKSTLLRHLFPDIPYCSLEDPDTRLFASSDPKGFLSGLSDKAIIDEVQRVPDLLSYIQSIVDLHPERKFYLTGSSNFALIRQITQSLAGRTALFELLPLSLREIKGRLGNMGINDLLYKGFYPALWCDKNIPRLFYPNYTRTYLERDVRDLLAIRDLDAFHKFVSLCAGRIGSVFNSSELSNEIGVSVNTINAWLSVLQASYIVYLLPPFFTNTRKRLTKSPKIYFYDTGLASWLLEIESPSVMERDKMRGHLFENMIIMEYMKGRFNMGRTPYIYFYRDSNGNEVDLLEKSGSTYNCMEIKSAMTFNPDFIKGLSAFDRAFPDLTGRKKVIYAGESMGDFHGVDISNFRDIL